MLENLKPERVFYYFEKLTEIPRESGNEQAVSDFLYNLGRELGLESVQDTHNNVIIKKPAHEDYLDHPTVVLQGHMDMVAEKADGIDHDFMTDKIPLVIDGDWLKTEGTTLGADNGIAVAMGLAIIEDKSLKHPPLELLITTNEETTMSGARAIQKDDIQGRMLLNIDAEEEGVLLSGCSGGHNLIGEMSLSYQDNPMKNTFELSVLNMSGGHSGMDIHENRGNSIKFITRVFQNISAQSPCELVSIDGGTKHNAIPRDAKIIFTSNEDQYDLSLSDLMAEYPLDTEMRVAIEKVDNVEKVLSDENKNNILNFINDVPNGVFSMMDDYPSIVECSNNLAIIETNNNQLKVTISLRSSNPEIFDQRTEQIKQIFTDCGFNVTLEDYYSPWVYSQDSNLRDIVTETYSDIYNEKMKIEVIHAALEPAVFFETFPDMDMVSVGPLMKDVHSPKERLSIPSTQRTYNLLVNILERL